MHRLQSFVFILCFWNWRCRRLPARFLSAAALFLVSRVLLLFWFLLGYRRPEEWEDASPSSLSSTSLSNSSSSSSSSSLSLSATGNSNIFPGTFFYTLKMLLLHKYKAYFKLNYWPFFLCLAQLLLVTLDFCLRWWCLEKPGRFSSSDSLSSLSLSHSGTDTLAEVDLVTDADSTFSWVLTALLLWLERNNAHSHQTRRSIAWHTFFTCCNRLWHLCIHSVPTEERQTSNTPCRGLIVLLLRFLAEPLTAAEPIAALDSSFILGYNCSDLLFEEGSEPQGHAVNLQHTGKYKIH